MKVLLADDEPIARTLIQHWLTGWGYDVVTAKDGNEAVQQLEANPDIKLAVLDWIMPGMDGVDVARRIRARGAEPYVFVVLLTARDSKADLVAGLDAGADDYIGKPCNPLELEVRLRTGRRIVELQDQLIAAREQMRFEAMHDSLTSLPNRPASLAQLDQELARSARTGEPVSVLMIDLDHFKRVNDTHGHAAGDAVLCDAASRLRAAVRPYDLVGRVGGEEFIAVLPDCPAEVALRVAARLLDRVASRPIPLPGGAAVSCTASIGVASTERTPSGAAGALVAAADRALYRAKECGRDRAIPSWADESQPDTLRAPAIRVSHPVVGYTRARQ